MQRTGLTHIALLCSALASVAQAPAIPATVSLRMVRRFPTRRLAPAVASHFRELLAMHTGIRLNLVKCIQQPLAWRATLVLSGRRA